MKRRALYSHSPRNAKQWCGRILVGALIMSLLGGGCAPSATSILNKSTAIRFNGADGPTLELSNIIINVPLDTIVGYTHTGLVNIPGSALYASKIAGGVQMYVDAAIDEFREANYRMTRPAKSLFGADVDSLSQAELLVGGIISNCEYNTYSSIGGEKTEALVDIKWKIMDRSSKVVIFERQTRGEAESPGDDNINAVASAVRGSLREVLADQQFVDLLSSRVNGKAK